MRNLALYGLVLTLPAGIAVAGDNIELLLPNAIAEEPPLVIEPVVAFQADVPRIEVEPATSDEDWAIAIVPRPNVLDDDASPAAEYQHLYDAIPFSRAEYLANASYRHDSAMALLTGQPINGRTAPNRNLEEYQNSRRYRRTFFPRLSPADLHYKYSYGLGPYGYRFGFPYGGGWGFGFGRGR